MPAPTTPREQRSFEYHWSNVMERMCVAYLHVLPDRNRPDFTKWMLDMIKAQRDPDQVARDHGGRSGLTELLTMAATYCASAAIARAKLDANSDALSWTYLVDAQFYVGAALLACAQEKGWPEIEEATRRAATASVRRKGGEARNRCWKIIEDEAVRLVRERGKRGQRWRNRREMARSIADDLLPVLDREVPGFSKDRYVTTISNRLEKRTAEIGRYLTPRGQQ